jgi:hypothetical protein
VITAFHLIVCARAHLAIRSYGRAHEAAAFDIGVD